MKTPDFLFVATPDERGYCHLGAARDRMIGYLKQYAGQPVEIRLRPHKATRSVQANARYWALITLGAQSLGYADKDELHEAVAFKLLRLPDDDKLGTPRRERTPNLNTAEFADYCNQVEWLLVEYGADLSGWEEEARRIQGVA